MTDKRALKQKKPGYQNDKCLLKYIFESVRKIYRENVKEKLLVWEYFLKYSFNKNIPCSLLVTVPFSILFAKFKLFRKLKGKEAF